MRESLEEPERQTGNQGVTDPTQATEWLRGRIRTKS